MKKLILLSIVLIVGLIGCVDKQREKEKKAIMDKVLSGQYKASSNTTTSYPSQTQIDAIQTSLGYEGEDRWADWKASIVDGEILIRVAADPRANDIAMRGYIDLIADICRKHAKGHGCYIRILQMGDVKKSKYISGK